MNIIGNYGFDRSQLEGVLAVLTASNLQFFEPVYQEALFAVFGEDELEPEDIENFLSFLESELCGDSGYRELDDETQLSLYTRPENRRIDRLINSTKVAVDTPLLGLLAIELTLEAIALWQTSKEVTGMILNKFGEASEAVALSRTASFVVHLMEEYHHETIGKEVFKLKRHKIALAENAKRKHELEQQKLEFTMSQITGMCQEIWRDEPFVPYGLLAEQLVDRLDYPIKKSDRHFLPHVAKLKQRLEAIAPSSAKNKGRPRRDNSFAMLSEGEKLERIKGLINKSIKAFDLPF